VQRVGNDVLRREESHNPTGGFLLATSWSNDGGNTHLVEWSVVVVVVVVHWVDVWWMPRLFMVVVAKRA
jgi:hypothetical protein